MLGWNASNQHPSPTSKRSVDVARPKVKMLWLIETVLNLLQHSAESSALSVHSARSVPSVSLPHQYTDP